MQVASFDAVDSGELEHSIYGYFDPESRIGYVIAGAPHAFYVEYGTGIIGQYSPHPWAGDENWTYDVNGHGMGGWYYLKGTDETFSAIGETWWTRGQPAKPFMYNTFVWLEEAAQALGRTILS